MRSHFTVIMQLHFPKRSFVTKVLYGYLHIAARILLIMTMLQPFYWKVACSVVLALLHIGFWWHFATYLCCSCIAYNPMLVYAVCTLLNYESVVFAIYSVCFMCLVWDAQTADVSLWPVYNLQSAFACSSINFEMASAALSEFAQNKILELIFGVGGC